MLTNPYVFPKIHEIGIAASKRFRDGNGVFSINMLIFDWKMPDLDGLETARRIRTLPPGDQMPPVLPLTAYTKRTLTALRTAAALRAF